MGRETRTRGGKETSWEPGAVTAAREKGGTVEGKGQVVETPGEFD